LTNATGLRYDGSMEKKVRFSVTRNFILSLLNKSKQPLSVFDLQKVFKTKKFLVNKTTIYRELDFLKSKKVIEEFQLDDGVRRYEILSNHHHHTICVRCRKINCVELEQELKSQEIQIEKNNKFKIISHSLEFYGLCQKCQAVKK
jgi:Fur family ferric uptake transcriptional regulator